MPNQTGAALTTQKLFQPLSWLSTLCAALLAVSPVAADVLTPMTAEYTVNLGDKHLGKGRIALYERANNCYEYTYEIQPRMAIRWLVGEIDERSQFCVVDNKIRPSGYQFSGRIKPDYRLEFDWTQMQVTSDGQNPRAISDIAMDRLAMHMAVRINTYGTAEKLPEEPFSIDVVEEKRIKTYQFKITGREQVSNAAGRFNTIRVDRINDPKKKSTFWIAPELDYALVKFFQKRKDDPEIVVNLTSSPNQGQPVPWDEEASESRRKGPRR